jgi:hypothetical protein
MKIVVYTGPDEDFPYGNKTALMDDKGRVQLCGPKDMWRCPPKYHTLCYGWHDVTRWKRFWKETNDD